MNSTFVCPTHRTSRTTLTCRTLLLAAFLLAPILAHAGKGPNYRYGEMWWAEYDSDKGTELLLHFGAPTPTARRRLVSAVEQRKKDEMLGDTAEIDAKGHTALDAELPKVGGELDAKPAIDEKALAPGTVADYSNERRIVRLGDGMALVPEGRFGQGLKTAGTGRIEVTARAPIAAECWFRVDQLPRQEACLMSLGNDEARLLLRPDGRLELRLNKPHGSPDEKKLPPEVLQVMLARPAEIIAPEPVTPARWTHVAIYSIAHPAPGNTSPFEAMLQVDGARVAHYLSEGGNNYDFLGSRDSRVVIGNSAKGDQGFAGSLDEVRVSSADRNYFERPALPWRDAAATRPLQFNRPFFRSDGTVVHASLDHGTKLDIDTAGAGAIQLDLHGESVDGVLVDGIRGKGWVMDPDIGFARVPLKGITARAGALEFWLRAVNWDDVTGYWVHSPPLNLNLSVARVFTRTADGKDKLLFNITLPRAFNLERARVPVDPGHWLHMALVWDAGGWGLFVNDRVIHGGRREAGTDLDAALSCAEFGVRDDITVVRNEKPRIEIDEVVGYRAHLRNDEVAQAHRRWMGKLEAIPLYNDGFEFKWALQRLEFSLTPLLPEGVTPASCSVALYDLGQDGKAVLGSGESKTLTDGAFRLLLSDGKPLPLGHYEFRFQVKDSAGKVAAEGKRDWKYEEEPWRKSAAGVLDTVPPPWTAIKVDGAAYATRMSRYLLGADGLPAEIQADGQNLLAAPVQLLEAGQPMAGKMTTGTNRGVDAGWTATFTGRTCDVALACSLEYDGMVRCELRVKPKAAQVAELAFVVPMQAAHATRWLAYPVGERGPRTGVVGAKDGIVLTSRADPASWEQWKAFQAEQKKSPKLTWDEYWLPVRDKTEAYGFYTHADLNDMNRGLWWFCDNAAGWVQSKKKGAVEIVRQGDTVSLRLNLVAEAAEYQPGKPIVFGLLPHPARPLPDKSRLFNRVAPEKDPIACDIYDAFYPWPADPRDHSMKLYPAADPKQPAAGPSWSYAESCIPIMKACKSKGARTMYLSKAWFSCRAGAYDNWEWRSGDSSAVSLTPSFVNYLSWEMNEWVRRGFWDAIYLDEAYEHPAKNLEAGFSVKLPDGTEQPGVTNFQFRELMKRWRGVFHQNGREPLLIAHLTYSWQYQGVVFCDSYLDGENRPIVSLQSRDWIDSTSQTQFEVVQNARLWGVSSFYMPFIAEGGFENKTKSQFLRWQWRMARQAQSMFAHYETATVYEGQGAQVYKTYWSDLYRWGVASPAVTFHPYWDNAQYLKLAEVNPNLLVSFYRKPTGGVLLIASNRAKTDAVAQIKLDTTALGLAAAPRVTELDGTYEPAKGDDWIPEKTKAENVKSSAEGGLAMEGEADDSLERVLGEETAEAKAKAMVPGFANGVLTVPIRARDYRVIALQ